MSYLCYLYVAALITNGLLGCPENPPDLTRFSDQNKADPITRFVSNFAANPIKRSQAIFLGQATVPFETTQTRLVFKEPKKFTWE